MRRERAPAEAGEVRCNHAVAFGQRGDDATPCVGFIPQAMHQEHARRILSACIVAEEGHAGSRKSQGAGIRLEHGRDAHEGHDRRSALVDQGAFSPPADRIFP